jgi:hypothetical protein
LRSPVCTTTYMPAAGLASTLYKKFGGKWYFITPGSRIN